MTNGEVYEIVNDNTGEFYNYNILNNNESEETIDISKDLFYVNQRHYSNKVQY